MGTSFGLVWPLWSFDRDGGALLEHIVGEMGVDHIVAPAVTGPARACLLAFDDAEPGLFESAGGWHFPAQAECYQRTALRPVNAKWFAKRNVLARLAEFTRERGLPLHIRVDLRRVAALPTQHPHLRKQGLLGPCLEPDALCPLNSDLIGLLRDTFDDLRSFEPAVIQLVDWVDNASTRSPTAFEAGTAALFELGPGVCFCPACMAAAKDAGIDATQVRHDVQSDLMDELGSDHPLSGRADVLARHSVLQEIKAARLQRWTALREELAAQLSPTKLRLVETVSPDTQLPLQVSDIAGVVARPAFDAAVDAVARVNTPCWLPAFESPDALVRGLHAAAAAGCAQVDLEALDAAPPEAQVWLRQALRFARREMNS